MFEQITRTKNIVKVLAVALLMVGGALVGMGTYAHFSDTDASSANTATSDSLDLTIDGANNGVTSSFSLTNAGPGDTVSHTYDLRNVEALSADHVEVTISATENDGGLTEPADTELDTELGNVQTQQQIRVLTYEYQNDTGSTLTDMLSGVTDKNNNGIKDVAEVINQTGTTDNLAAPLANSGNTTKLVIKLQFANDDGSYTGTDEDIMADGIDVKLDVTLNQDSTQ